MKKSKCLLIILLLVSVMLVLNGCVFGIEDSFKPPSTKREVERELEKRYDEEFVVTEKERLPPNDDCSRISAFTVHPKANPELEFFAFESFSIWGPFGTGGGVPTIDIDMLIEDQYIESLIVNTVHDWLEENEIKYEKNYPYESWYINVNDGEVFNT